MEEKAGEVQAEGTACAKAGQPEVLHKTTGWGHCPGLLGGFAPAEREPQQNSAGLLTTHLAHLLTLSYTHTYTQTHSPVFSLLHHTTRLTTP